MMKLQSTINDINAPCLTGCSANITITNAILSTSETLQYTSHAAEDENLFRSDAALLGNFATVRSLQLRSSEGLFVVAAILLQDRLDLIQLVVDLVVPRLTQLVACLAAIGCLHAKLESRLGQHLLAVLVLLHTSPSCLSATAATAWHNQNAHLNI